MHMAEDRASLVGSSPRNPSVTGSDRHDLSEGSARQQDTMDPCGKEVRTTGSDGIRKGYSTPKRVPLSTEMSDFGRFAAHRRTIMSYFDRSLTESIVVTQLTFNSQSSANQHNIAVLELVQIPISNGADIVGVELTTLQETLSVQDMEAKQVQETVAQQIAQRLGHHELCHEKHEVVSSQLYANIGTAGQESLSGDIRLEQVLN